VLLLDTHAWVWHVEGDSRRLGPRARRLIARAESEGRLRLSPVTLFEIAALHTAGRVRFTRPLEQWIREALEAARVRLADLSPGVAVDAGAIPRNALGDPLDRLLVATARQIDADLLTGDRRILGYGGGGHVRVRDATV
jgi:PIN domain nuclease of toxin-antitoxin system